MRHAKFNSRKLYVLAIQIILTVILPLAYKRNEISDQVILFVLVTINGAGAVYTGANLLSKKYFKENNG